MSTSPHIANVTLKDFTKRVLEKSREVPVLVDFWAEWCGPCRMLTPVLTRLAEVYAGKLFLAKVDTDVERELAKQYGIRSLPTVKVFRNGQVVTEFMGAQPESAIRRCIDPYIARESDALVDKALVAHRSGQDDEAVSLLRSAVEADAVNDRAKLVLASIYVEQSRLDEAQAVHGMLSAQAKTEPEALALAGRIRFARIAASAPPAEELEKMIAANPDNCEALSQLSARQVLANDYEPALSNLLEIVKRNRRFHDDAGRKYMLAVFDLLGGKGELVNKYRGLLSSALN
ncbi:MAG: thioredoxin [Acidiferrobacterales bacterium]